jgi:hypothetical protein
MIVPAIWRRVGVALVAAVAILVALAVRLAEPRPRPALAGVPGAAALHLAATDAPLVLLGPSEPLPPEVGPVLEVADDGSVAFWRGAGIGGRWPVAIVVPAADLHALGASARGALANVIGQLVVERPVPPARVHLLGVAAQASELTALLAWVP